MSNNSLGQEYLPSNLDRLFERLGIEGSDYETRGSVDAQARSFFESLRQMTPDERGAIITLIRYGCCVDMPDSIHINTDYLRRLTGKPVNELMKLLGDVRSLGFVCAVKDREDHKDFCAEGEILGSFRVFELCWSDLLAIETKYPPLFIAREMILEVSERYCECCLRSGRDEIDFSFLSNANDSGED